jgi:hypothetical protein
MKVSGTWYLAASLPSVAFKREGLGLLNKSQIPNTRSFTIVAVNGFAEC